MNKIVVAVGWMLTSLGILGVMLGVYEVFTTPGLVILGIWFCSSVLIALGLVLWFIGRRMERRQLPRNPLG